MRIFVNLKSCKHETCKSDSISSARAIEGIIKRNIFMPWIVAMCLTLTAQQAWTCTLSVTGVNFGSYDVFNNAPLISTGNVNVNCDSGIEYSITLSAGNGTYTQRTMSNGTKTLKYNLYTATNRAIVWGDGTRNTTLLTDTGCYAVISDRICDNYPYLHNVYTESCNDTIIVVVTFQWYE